MREMCQCGHPLINHWQTGKRLCMACPDGGCADFTPAPAEGTDELREALAQTLYRHHGGDDWSGLAYEEERASYRSDADALLAGPLAALLAKVQAVEALAEELAGWPSSRILSPHDAADRLRRALNGESRG